MSHGRSGPHEPVGADLTSAATARVDAEARRAGRRTGRRLALTAVAVAAVSTTTFCGTGLVANAQQLRLHRRYGVYASIAAEYDCCVTPPRGQAVAPCAEAIAELDIMHEQLRSESLAARFSSWIAATTGLSPELFSISTPAADDIAALHARCHR